VVSTHTRTDSVSVVEKLVPIPITVKGDSLVTSFPLTIESGKVKPATIVVDGPNTTLTVNIDPAGTLTATSHTPNRTDTIFVPEKTIYQGTQNHSTQTTTSIKNRYPKWMVTLAIIGLLAIVYIAFRVYRFIRPRFPP
jgi:hypothetical protein